MIGMLKMEKKRAMAKNCSKITRKWAESHPMEMIFIS